MAPLDSEPSQNSLNSVLQPIELASGLPNEAYTSAQFADFERDQLLAKSWMSIGLGRQVPNPGDVHPVEVHGLPLVLVRGRDQRVRVFHNVCSHRGVQLVAETGSVGHMIACRYHCWTYDLTGRLRATPHIGGPECHSCDGFDKSKHGLKEVPSAVWADIVFVNLSGDAPPFESFLAPVLERWGDFDLDQLKPGSAESDFAIDVACNWKLAVENYCESYHLPWIHPGLNSYSRLEDHYNIEQAESFAGQGTLAYRPILGEGAGFPHFDGEPEGWQERGEYLALFPNTLIGLHGDHFFAVIVLPLGAEASRELFALSYIGEAATDDEHRTLREVNARQWRAVFDEDRDIVEAMQSGRRSPGFKGGAFSPVMDGPTHCFHRWNAERLLAAGYQKA